MSCQEPPVRDMVACERQSASNFNQNNWWFLSNYRITPNWFTQVNHRIKQVEFYKFKKNLANLVITASLFVGGCAMPQRMDEYREHPEKYNANYSAAILVAKPTAFYDYLAIPFMGIYELRVANALKTKLGVDSYYFVKNAEWKDLESALLDDKIKVVVVAGHGDDKGCSIGADESYLMTLFIYHPEIKKDWFIRHTCGSLPKEQEYVPRAALQKILQNINDDYADTGVSIGTCFGFLIPSKGKLMEEFYKARSEKNITDEEYDYFIKKEKYLNEVVIPKINSELNEKIKESIVKAKDTFGYITVEDPSHVLGWDRVTTPLDFLLNPLPGLDKVKDKN